MAAPKKKVRTSVVLPSKGAVSFKTRFMVRLSHTERLMFVKYLTVLVRAGLAMPDALQILLDQASGPTKVIVDSLTRAVKSGKTLASGFASFPHIFGEVFVSLVAAGEASGTLETNLEHLASQLEKQHELRQRVRGALMYPAVVISGAILLSIGIVIFILPNIVGVFRTLSGVELPFTTRALLWIADVVRGRGVIILAGLVGAVIGWTFLRRMNPVKRVTHEITLHLPILGSLARKTHLAHFTRLLGTLLKSGMPISEAIPITATVISNVRYRALFTPMAAAIKGGDTLSSFFEKYPKRFPPILRRMVHVGEETGTLGDMLLSLAEFYEEEVSDTTKNLSNLLEPVLLVFIGSLVGILALSILSPIYQIVGNI